MKWNRWLPMVLLTAGLAAGSTAEPPQALPETGRVLLAPLNLGVRATPALEPGIEPVWDELVRVLGERETPPAALQGEAARALFAEVMRVEAQAEEEARDGVYAAYARFARRVAEQVEFDALVMPALVVRRAEIRGPQASWDGVHRLVEMPRPRALDGRLGVVAVGGRGSLEAASLHVAILAPSGEIRFEGAGGLALLQDLALGEDAEDTTLRVTDRPEPFADAASLRRGIEVAFEHPLPAADAP